MASNDYSKSDIVNDTSTAVVYGIDVSVDNIALTPAERKMVHDAMLKLAQHVMIKLGVVLNPSRFQCVLEHRSSSNGRSVVSAPLGDDAGGVEDDDDVQGHEARLGSDLAPVIPVEPEPEPEDDVAPVKPAKAKAAKEKPAKAQKAPKEGRKAKKAATPAHDASNPPEPTPVPEEDDGEDVAEGTGGIDPDFDGDDDDADLRSGKSALDDWQ